MNSAISRFRIKYGYYPLFLDISDKLCIVLGGGKVAERKVSMLLQFKAKVKLISPKATKNLLKLSRAGKIEIVERAYRGGDLNGASLVFAATDRDEINRRIKKEAESNGIPINVADDPILCDFIVPSIVKKGPITIAISTSGTLPLLSKKLREQINDYITKDYVKYARLIGKFRKLLMTTVKDKQKRKVIMGKIDKVDYRELANMNIKAIVNRFLIEKE